MNNYQALFQHRWPQLTHPHVRSLAWLIDSPHLLNTHHPRWNDRLAELSWDSSDAQWLLELEKKPTSLDDYLAVHHHTRLGNYAEDLLAFYFSWRGTLAAHRVQVRSHTTIGEFDFLLNTKTGLEHWEFACKFYLLVAPETSLSNYVGPNLMDNLQEKSKKIMDVQLALGQHPDAKQYLPTPLSASKALVKGWLFYATNNTSALDEITPEHCRGLWCRLSELKNLNSDCFTLLSRLQWLAPAKVRQTETMPFEQLQAHLTQLFKIDNRPVLVAQLIPVEDFFVECERIFVVPDMWNL